jgi:hypothetical protein
MANTMDLKHHNEIIDIPMNIEVNEKYPIILDKLLMGKKESCYFNFFINYESGKILVMRTKNCFLDKQIKWELRDKYLTIYKISLKNNEKITIVKVTINNTGMINNVNKN